MESNDERNVRTMSEQAMHRHRVLKEGLQDTLRTVAVLGMIGGIFVAIFAAGAAPYDVSALVFFSTIGSIGSGALLLWVAAAIIDALRVIAANSFRDATTLKVSGPPLPPS